MPAAETAAAGGEATIIVADTSDAVVDAPEPQRIAAVGEGAGSETGSETSAIASLSPVPPNGIESLTPEGLKYFQGMGPLEYAARLAGEPAVPTWRVRLRLIPQDTGEPDGFAYLVKTDHYNLSPALYDSLVASYGDNADPSLNDDSPHQSFQLTFAPVMSIAADWLSDRTQFSRFPVTDNPPCDTAAQFQLGCAELFSPLQEDAWKDMGVVSVEAAPWDEGFNPLYGMVRMLAQQAGNLEAGGNAAFWVDGEIPEGSGEARPWVEVLIDNYAGNGGGYQGFWIERAADDSISSVIHHVYYGGVGTSVEGRASRAVVCRRGDAAGQIRPICP